MELIIHASVEAKLAEKHKVFRCEIIECFSNREGKLLEDTRAGNKTDPPTLWFVAETDHGRRLKVVFIKQKNGSLIIKSAYEANQEEERIYRKFGL